MRGAGVYGGRAPEPVADPGELSREMDRIQAQREAEDRAAYERAREPRGEYDAEPGLEAAREAGQ